MKTTQLIYTLPEPLQGFIRLDTIYAVISADAMPEHTIKDRVIIRYGIPVNQSGMMRHLGASDEIIYCESKEEADRVANEIHQMVEEYHAAYGNVPITELP